MEECNLPRARDGYYHHVFGKSLVVKKYDEESEGNRHEWCIMRVLVTYFLGSWFRRFKIFILDFF